MKNWRGTRAAGWNSEKSKSAKFSPRPDGQPCRSAAAAHRSRSSLTIAMQFYYAEEPASPLDFDDEGEQTVAAAAAPSAAAAKSMAPAINRAGAFREELHASINWAASSLLPACLPDRNADISR